MRATISQLFFSRPVQSVAATALFWRGGDKDFSLTQGEFTGSVRAFAKGLLALGISPGERIAIIHENAPEWIIADLALASIGAISVPLYTTLSAADKSYEMNDSSVTAAIFSERHDAEMIGLKHGVKTLRHLITTGNGAKDGILAFKSIMALGKESGDDAVLDARIKGVREGDPFTIIYSSGTTGKPKGVILSHANIVSNITASIEFLGLCQTDRYLSYLPMSHVFERMIHHIFVSLGATICYSGGIAYVGADARHFKPAVMVGVPFFFERVMGRIKENIESSGAAAKLLFNAGVALNDIVGSSFNPLDWLVLSKVREKAVPGLRFFVSGGAALTKETADFFWSLGIPVLQGYGLTETSPVVSVNTVKRNKNGTVGQILSGVKVKIAEDGEILVSGPNIMQGYLNMPEATREAVIDGWFRTGDIGTIDSEGFLSITGRKKDIIVTSGGKNIAPQRIEALLKADEFIAEALIYGDGRPHLVAFIIPDFERLSRDGAFKGKSKESIIGSAEVKAFLRSRIKACLKGLSRHEQVRDFALIDMPTMEGGEMTPTMKIKRKKMEERYCDIINGLYEHVYSE